MIHGRYISPGIIKLYSEDYIMSSINCIKNTQFNCEKACFDNGCESECYFSNNTNNPFGISVLPGSNKLIEYPQKKCNLNGGYEDGTSFLNCIQNSDLCPRTYPPTSICIRACTDFAAIAQVNFFNGDLIICDKIDDCPNNSFEGLPVPFNDLLDILPNLLGINGSLYIIGTQYRRITGFDKLRFVTGSIVIVNNPDLVSIPSFPSLLNVGGQIIFYPLSSDVNSDNISTLGRSSIIIANNANLRKISGFEAVRQVQDGIFIADNNSLTHICGFIHLYRTDRIVIRGNQILTKIVGFCYIDTINICLLILSNNVNGKNDLIIGAFTNLENAGRIVIIDNHGLKSIKFDALQVINNELVIRYNDQLEEIISSVYFVNDIFIEYNKKLTHIDFPCLQGINSQLNINANNSLLCLNTFDQMRKIGGGIIIADNKLLTEINGFNKLKYIGSRHICRPIELLPVDFINDISFDWTTIVVTEDCVVIDDFTGDIFDGSLSLGTYQVPDEFFNFTCNSIKSCCDAVDDESIPTCLSYSLIIFHNQHLKAIGGFCNLKHVNSNIYIINNNILHTIQAFSQLAFVLDICIRNNPLIKYIIGFCNILSIRDFIVSESSNLIDLNSIKSLEFAQKIAIEAKNSKTVKYSKNPIPSVLGYVLYYCHDN